ncbi:MAG: DNA topoisomerase I [Nitrososphaerales archaeon]
MKWKTLEHKGVAFSPDYEPRGFRIRLRGKTIALNPYQEEMAVAWAKKKDTPYVVDPVFAKNFIKDFLRLFPPEFKDVTIKDIDFSEIYAWIDKEKTFVLDKETKKKRAAERKKIREELKEEHGEAKVDGQTFDIANWMVEPPGIFMGRGKHPLRGKWKPRVYAKDITLNLGEDAQVPRGDWGQIVHDHDSMWLARWIDRLAEKEKYVWLSDAATLRQERDKTKYDKASKLSQQIEKVVNKIYKKMESKDVKERKVAIVCYLIYKLAMRVGDEKDPDEADTVGATTLRVEHVKLNGKTIEFDFLGKDSVRWQKSIELGGRDSLVYENMREFIRGKRQDELIFSGITSRNVNNFLSEIVGGLSAKVFRTYLGTEIVKNYLSSIYGKIAKSSDFVKIYHAKMANLQAAIACNHKKAPAKNFEQTLEKKKERLKKLQETKPKTEKQRERLKERREKVELQLKLAESTKDYNLGTSLRNYIDPRLIKAWADHVYLDWKKIYTSALQRKFMWVEKETPPWQKILVKTC